MQSAKPLSNWVPALRQALLESPQAAFETICSLLPIYLQSLATTSALIITTVLRPLTMMELTCALKMAMKRAAEDYDISTCA